MKAFIIIAIVIILVIIIISGGSSTGSTQTHADNLYDTDEHDDIHSDDNRSSFRDTDGDGIPDKYDDDDDNDGIPDSEDWDDDGDGIADDVDDDWD